MDIRDLLNLYHQNIHDRNIILPNNFFRIFVVYILSYEF